ncbi:MAG: polysaccharide biosynthesis tyrosine autokinase [Tunicatimonas sp.]
MEETDIRVVIRKLFQKWYWFALSLLLTLSLALLYLWVADEDYRVVTTIQLKDQSLGGKAVQQEEFLNAFNLLQSDSELEDEIGILTAYSTVQRSLSTLNFETSYYAYPAALGWFATAVADEIYPSPFQLVLDTLGGELLDTPIMVSFPDEEHYRIRIDADEKPLLIIDGATQQVNEWSGEILIDTTLSLSEPLSLPYLNVSLRVTNPTQAFTETDTEYYVVIRSLGDLTESYQNALLVETISENSNIARLSLVSATPEKDKRFLSELIEVYVDNDLAKKNRLGKRTIEFIDFQIATVADSLRKTEGSLEDFRGKNQVIDVSVTSQNLTDQLFTLEEKQAQLSVQNEYYKYMAQYLASNDNVTDVVAPSSVGIQDELLNSLLIQLANLNEEKISKDYSSNPNNPVLQVLERKINNTKQALIDNIDNLINSNDIGLRENSRRIRAIRQSMSELPQNERNLTDINRRFAFNDNIYNYLLQKRAEAGIAIASNVPDKTMIDAPRQVSDKPESPKPLFVLLLAVMLGLLIPAGFIFVNDYFDSKVESSEQINQWAEVPVIERIAQVKEKEKRQLYGSDSYLSHTFRYVRHHIDFLRLSQDVKVVGVTSARSGEGKTFVARYLAESFAQAGRKTLLIDADLHHPTLASLLQVRGEPGLSDMLLRADNLAVQATRTSNLDFIGSGSPRVNASDLLTSDALGSLMARLKNEYEIVIVDTPPLGAISDYLLLSKHVDYTLWTVRHQYSLKDDLERVNQLIQRNHLKAGIVYNGVQSTDVDTQYYKKSYRRKA